MQNTLRLIDQKYILALHRHTLFLEDHQDLTQPFIQFFDYISHFYKTLFNLKDNALLNQNHIFQDRKSYFQYDN